MLLYGPGIVLKSANLRWCYHELWYVLVDLGNAGPTPTRTLEVQVPNWLETRLTYPFAKALEEIEPTLSLPIVGIPLIECVKKLGNGLLNGHPRWIQTSVFNWSSGRGSPQRLHLRAGSKLHISTLVST